MVTFFILIKLYCSLWTILNNSEAHHAFLLSDFELQRIVFFKLPFDCPMIWSHLTGRKYSLRVLEKILCINVISAHEGRDIIVISTDYISAFMQWDVKHYWNVSWVDYIRPCQFLFVFEFQFEVFSLYSPCCKKCSLKFEEIFGDISKFRLAWLVAAEICNNNLNWIRKVREGEGWKMEIF